MPTDRVSRRTLIRGAAGAGAGLLLARSAPAKPADKSRVCWALVADTHIDASPEVAERGGQMDERFKLVVNDILAMEGELAGVMVDGDLAHRAGHPEAYTRLLGLAYPLRQAGINIEWLLGNHDNREHFLQAACANRMPELAVKTHYARVVERAGVRWLLLDSLIRPNHIPGEIGPDQMAWMQRELDAAKDTPAILILHHNVDEQGGQVVDGKALFELARSNRQVKALFQGHNHAYETRDVDGLHFVKLPAVGYAFSEDQPIGYIRAWVDSSGCELELRAVDGNKRLHGEKVATALADVIGRRRPQSTDLRGEQGKRLTAACFG